MSTNVDTWSLNASGLTSVAANWSGGIPARGSDVVVAPTAAGVVVTFDALGYTLGALTLDNVTGVLQGGDLAASAGVTFQAATLRGPHALVVGGQSQATGLTLGGGATLYNKGVLMQAGGAVEIGLSATSRALIVNMAGADWIDSDDSGLTQGAGAGGAFVNAGTFTDSAGGGVTLVGVNFNSTGTIDVAVHGTLEFLAKAALSGTFSGGGLIEYGAAAAATLGALTVAATSQTNSGVVNQTGTMTLSGVQTIMNNHIWNLVGDVSMTADAGAEFFDLPSGLLEKTSGTGVSDIAVVASLYGAVDVAAGTLEFSGPTTGFVGPVYGAGTLEISAGVAEFAPNGASAESISVANLLLDGGVTQVLGSVTDSGAFEGDAGATLSLGPTTPAGPGFFTVTGSADFDGLDLVGHGEFIVEATGSATVSGLTLGGSAVLFDRGVVSQSGGNLTIGDAVQADAASLFLDYGGVYNITDASGILAGASSGDIITIGDAASGAGALLEKTGAGVSVVAPFVENNASNIVTSAGTQYEGLEAAAGTLDVKNAVGGAGTDNIVGAATLEFDGAVQAGQTVSFFGAGGTLDIGDIVHFSAGISGFDTVGSNDALIIAFNVQFTGATESGTATTLNFAAGAHDFSLNLTGDYQGGAFTAQPQSIGGPIKVTYQANTA